MNDARRLLGAEHPKLHTDLLERDQALAGLAGRQHGVVGKWQLQQLGLSDQMIKTKIAHGGLSRLHRGVYAVGHRALTVESRWMAAVLAHGPEAVLSHRSAGQLWGICPRSDVAPEVTCPGSKKTKRGIVAHGGSLPADEVVRRWGIPVTSVARTMLDLAATRSEREVERAWNQMEFREYRHTLSVPDLVERHRGRPGSVLLRRLAGGDTLPVGITRNDFEEAFLGLIDRHGLPRPRMNAHVHLRGRFYEIDCLWDEQRVAIELDGGAAHKTRKAFNDDRERDRILTVEGFTATRVTWDHLQNTPQDVADDLREILTPYPSSNESGALRPLPPR
jgi:very-short-patch-repair endonuclease